MQENIRMTHTLHYFPPPNPISRTSVVSSCRGQMASLPYCQPYFEEKPYYHTRSVSDVLPHTTYQPAKLPSTPKKQKLNTEPTVNSVDMSKYSKPLFVDTSTEYNLPPEILPPKGSMSLLMIHPGYYEALRQSRAKDHRFQVNMPSPPRVSKRSPRDKCEKSTRRAMPPLIPANCDSCAPVLPPRRQQQTLEPPAVPPYRRQQPVEQVQCPRRPSSTLPSRRQQSEPVAMAPAPELPSRLKRHFPSHHHSQISLICDSSNAPSIIQDQAVICSSRNLSHKAEQAEQRLLHPATYTSHTWGRGARDRLPCWTIDSPPLLPPLAALTLANKPHIDNNSDQDSGFCTPQALTGDMDYLDHWEGKNSIIYISYYNGLKRVDTDKGGRTLHWELDGDPWQFNVYLTARHCPIVHIF